MQNLFVLLGLASFLAALVGLFVPGVLFFVRLEKRTRLRATGVYLLGAVACLVLAVAVAPKDEGEEYMAQLKAEAQVADQQYAERRAAAAPVAVPKVRPQVAPEQMEAKREALRGLYQELMQFKDDPAFHQMGFGVGLPSTHRWLQDVTALDKDVSFRKGYPMQLASAPGYLRQLGMEYMRSRGSENKDTRAFTQFVEEGLAK